VGFITKGRFCNLDCGNPSPDPEIFPGDGMESFPPIRLAKYFGRVPDLMAFF
jgi:hypothetical protein